MFTDCHDYDNHKFKIHVQINFYKHWVIHSKNESLQCLKSQILYMYLSSIC